LVESTKSVELYRYRYYPGFFSFDIPDTSYRYDTCMLVRKAVGVIHKGVATSPQGMEPPRSCGRYCDGGADSGRCRKY